VTVTEDNGLTCDEAGYQKPDDADLCVNGSIFVAEVDTSVFDGTSYDFSG